MRNMSFMLTEQQILNQTKFVTRRLGWRKLKAGNIFQPVLKGMGLKKGEKIIKLGCPCVVVATRFEWLSRILENFSHEDYGGKEMILEGFPGMPPEEFVEMFCRTHKGCLPGSEITRIEFRYLQEE